MYGGVFTALSNLGADPEACAAWCLSFRVPGFAGFMYGGTTGTKYCICRYSQYTVPQAPKETFDVMRQLSTGKGPIDHASGTDGVQCYKVAKYVSPLADFEKPRDGYCRDSKFRGYTKLYTLRNNIGGNAEDCAAWCSSFGVGGFVGIALDASYCYCTYSKYTVPAAPVANFEVIPSESHFSGMGEVGKGSGWAGASCYKIKKYRSPPVAIVIGAAMADELDLELDLSHLMIEGYEPTLADVMQAVQYAEIQKVLQDIEDKAEETQQAKEQIVDVQSAANQQIQQTEQEVVDLFSAAEQQTQQQIQDLFSNQDPLALFFP